MLDTLRSLPEKRAFRLAAIFSPLIIALVWMIFPGYFFLKNDDILIMQILKESGFAADFISVILTGFLNRLYTAIGGVEWFSLWLMASFILGFTAMHASVLRLRSWVPHIAILGFQVFCCSSFTYTTVAYVSIFSGMLLYIMNVDFGHLRKSILPMILGAALIFNGSILRTLDPFLSCAALIAPLALMKLIRKEQRFSALVMLMVICLACQGAVLHAHNRAVSSDPVIKDFQAFSEVRSLYSDNTDGHAPDEYIAGSGLYLSDDRLADRYNYADAGVFTVDWFKTVYGYTDSQAKDIPGTVIRVISSLLTYIITLDPGFVLAGLVCLFAVFAVFFRKKAISYVLMTIGLLALEFIYLVYIRRCLSRITMVLDCIVFVAVCIMLCSVPGETPVMRTKFVRFSRMMARVFCVLLACFLVYFTVFRLADSKRDPAAFNAHQQFIQSDDSGRYYVYEAATANTITDYTLSLTRRDNVTPVRLLGDWYARSPFWIEKMKQAGFEKHINTAMDILLEDGVCLVVYNPPEELPGYYADFFKNHRGLDVEWTVESAPASASFKFFDFNIVSIPESSNC